MRKLVLAIDHSVVTVLLLAAGVLGVSSIVLTITDLILLAVWVYGLLAAVIGVGMVAAALLSYRDHEPDQFRTRAFLALVAYTALLFGNAPVHALVGMGCLVVALVVGEYAFTVRRREWGDRQRRRRAFFRRHRLRGGDETDPEADEFLTDSGIDLDAREVLRKREESIHPTSRSQAIQRARATEADPWQLPPP